MDYLTYRNEKQRLKEYELIKVEQGNEEENKLAYGELNTRFLDMERQYMKEDEFQKKKEHIRTILFMQSIRTHRIPIRRMNSLRE